MNDFIIENACPEDAAAILDYLKIVGGETDNLTWVRKVSPLPWKLKKRFFVPCSIRPTT